MNDNNLNKAIASVQSIRMTDEDKQALWERLEKMSGGSQNGGDVGANGVPFSKLPFRKKTIYITSRYLVQNLGLLTLAGMILVVTFVNPGLNEHKTPKISPVSKSFTAKSFGTFTGASYVSPTVQAIVPANTTTTERIGL